MSGPSILLVFHTSEGHTAKLADRIAEVQRARGATVDVHPVDTAPAPVGYDAAVDFQELAIHRPHRS
jgi:menaquinone-dependent protoporphyrinogen IX oxidase